MFFIPQLFSLIELTSNPTPLSTIEITNFPSSIDVEISIYPSFFVSIFECLTAFSTSVTIDKGGTLMFVLSMLKITLY